MLMEVVSLFVAIQKGPGVKMQPAQGARPRRLVFQGN